MEKYISAPYFCALKLIASGFLAHSILNTYSSSMFNLAIVSELMLSVLMIHCHTVYLANLAVKSDESIRDAMNERYKMLLCYFLFLLLMIAIYVFLTRILVVEWREQEVLIGLAFTDNVREEDRGLPAYELLEKSSGRVEDVWVTWSVVLAYLLILISWILASLFLSLFCIEGLKSLQDKARLMRDADKIAPSGTP